MRLKIKQLMVFICLTALGFVPFSGCAHDDSVVSQPTTTAATANEVLLSPEGYWLVMTKDGKNKRSVAQIATDKDGTLSAKFIAIFYVQGRVWSDKCTDCIDQFHGQPLAGMSFLWGLQHQSSQWNSPWVSGKVFNPDANHVYRASIQLVSGGKELHLTGCQLMICRTSTWYRVAPKELPQYLAKSDYDFHHFPFSKSRT